jgi:hypothetical protein
MKRWFFAWAAVVFLWIVPEARAAVFDHSLFDQILRTYVDERGLIDYNGIAKDSKFYAYLKSLETARVDELSRDGQLALWINAYNAVIIDKVIKRKPKRSVRETAIPGVWLSTEIFTSQENVVANRTLSPDDIENEILRKEFKDPRIHFAIICASRGCPPMPRIAYTEENVQSRLEEETREYLHSSRGVRMDPKEKILYLSKIFDWFSDDFVRKSGSVLEFIKPYVSDQVRRFMEEKPKISYLDYDWSLNAQAPLK